MIVRKKLAKPRKRPRRRGRARDAVVEKKPYQKKLRASKVRATPAAARSSRAPSEVLRRLWAVSRAEWNSRIADAFIAWVRVAAGIDGRYRGAHAYGGLPLYSRPAGRVGDPLTYEVF